MKSKVKVTHTYSKVNPKATDKKTAEETKADPDAEILSYVNECQSKGDTYRQKFKTRWDEIESQIRCVHPDAWAKKEDWQTKVFIPQQSKTSETAQAYLDKMLFGSKRFFGIQGVEERDKNEEAAIEDLYDNVMNRGNFFVENDFVLNESCSGPGTSFLKVTCNPQRTGLIFSWRSAYNITIDPAGFHKLENSQYIIDEYERPLQELVDNVDKSSSVYKKEAIQKLIDQAEMDGLSTSEKALTVIKGFDGTAVNIDPNYKIVKIKEFWGMAKVSEKPKEGEKAKETWGERIIAVANGKVVLRNDANDYGFKPFFSCRVKPRKYDFYALGFLDNVVDLQELTNSLVNLGFDSLKMCAMDIAIIDATKIKDPASIEYRPMATWMMKGNPRESVLLTRQGISALSEIIRALTVLDQFNQEATGVLRQVQGAPSLAGGSGETLGEYQAKLAMIDNRFLKIARFIERDYVEPVLKGIFKIIFNPKFFNQKLVDRILGMKTVTTQDPMSGQPIKQQVSKLDFKKISDAGEMGYDFMAYGMTEFSKSLETLQKLKELLTVVTQTPQLQILFNIKELVKRTLRAAEISDYQDLMKSDEEIKSIMDKVYSGQGADGQGAQQAPQQPQAPPQKGPSESINFKDLPPEGQVQMAAKAGIQLNPDNTHHVATLKVIRENKNSQPRGAQ